MKHQTQELGPIEYAAYEMVRAGAMRPFHLPMFGQALANLAAQGMVKRDAQGFYWDADPDATPARKPPPEPKEPLNLRIPAAMRAALTDLAKREKTTVTEVATRFLAAGLAAPIAGQGSGARRKAG